jgi:hypothetical protein
MSNSICQFCEDEAVTFINGDVDSFGTDQIPVCMEHHATHISKEEEYETGKDVPERAPKPGHTFMINECTNLDGHGDWLFVTDSWQAATGYLRRITKEAAPFCGLYPNKGIREVLVMEAVNVKARHYEEMVRLQEDMEEFDEVELELQAEESDHTNYLMEEYYDIALTDDEELFVASSY